MGIRTYRPYTAGTRDRSVADFVEITKSEPEKSLTMRVHRNKGRNNRGVITCRHRGGGHKRLYRMIDFRRDKKGIPARVAAIEYDPVDVLCQCLFRQKRANCFGTFRAARRLSVQAFVQRRS